MRTFKKYYDIALKEHKWWFYIQKEEWWKDKYSFDYHLKGDYIETVRHLTVNEKNNSSLFKNHTNVKNSEWCIFFSMLGQALIDWCKENKIPDNIYSFNFNIDRSVDGLKNCYEVHWNYYIDNGTSVEKVENDTTTFEDCAGFLTDMVDMFVTKHGYNIPNDWNNFSFGLDDLKESIRFGKWVCSSDGYMNLANFVDSEDDGWTDFVECM